MKPPALLTVLLISGLTMNAAANDPAGDGDIRVYVGTYTREGSQGIYLLRFNSETGALSTPELAGEVENPSFLAIHPNGRFLYCVNEVDDFEGQPAGGVSALGIEPDGKLVLLNQQSSKGAAPCHIVLDKLGSHALVANYTGGSVAALPIESDGRLKPASAFVQHQGSSIDPRRQEGPHAHSINLDSTGRFAFVADLGLDQMLIYRFDAAKGTLTPSGPAFISVEPGSGPRHFSFHPNGRNAYAINEMACTVTAFAYDAKQPTLTTLHNVSTLPAGAKPPGTSTAEVLVHPSGRFVYGSNRGHDSIAVFAVDQQSGRLTPRGQQPTLGKTPRNFAIAPQGRFLLAANQSTGNIVVFRINATDGSLTPTGHEAKVPQPVCLRMLADETD